MRVAQLIEALEQMNPGATVTTRCEITGSYGHPLVTVKEKGTHYVVITANDRQDIVNVDGDL